MPGPCSAPLGYRDEKGPAPRTGKTQVVRGSAQRKALTDELARIAAKRQED